MTSAPFPWFLAAGLVVFSGCRTYEPIPLEPERLVAAVHEARLAPDGARTTAPSDVTMTTLARWMREHGPFVREAVAAYRTALARARIPTPLPNPGLEMGPQWGFGADVESVNEVMPLGSIGFTIPVGGRLARQDELNRAVAEVARVDAIARHRELYLELRARYAALVLAQAREELLGRISEAADRIIAVAHRLVDAGTASAIDVALFELEYARSLARKLEASVVTANAAASLSTLLGVHTERFFPLPENSLPDLGEPSNLEELRQLMLAHHPGLGRLRARYESAERALHLEIAKQYPDLIIGPSIEGEPGERRALLGLTLGIELPVFDRNQQSIAEALQRREEVRVQYEAAASRALAALERAHRLTELAAERRTLLQEQVLPRADASTRIARESLLAGSADALQLLDAERSRREVQIEVLESELVERAAWSALEQAVGYPILAFPSESAERTVLTPRGLEPPDGDAAIDEKEPR